MLLRKSQAWTNAVPPSTCTPAPLPVIAAPASLALALAPTWTPVPNPEIVFVPASESLDVPSVPPDA